MPVRARTLSSRTVRGRLVAVAVAVLVTAPFSPAGPAQAAPAAAPPLALASAGPTGGPMVSVRKVPRRVAKVRKALRIARQQQGDPYVYGAAGPNAFDCSGLVYYSTHRAGFTGVPRTSSAQSQHMRRIPRGAMRPGDFVFFTGSSGVYHVGIFVGGGRVLHAPGSGDRVRTDPLWTDSWFAGTLR